MAKIQVTIKNVDEDAFSELKAEAARKKLHVGAALSLAIEKWVSESKKPLLPFSKWKMIKGKDKPGYTSESVDSILYG
ncbi:hypothetical protein HYX06_00585 [Candidatus Woesearchaeota archaeon]|nr:hypothetical protein [Candidatus Woesearchaeota archaeon]